MKKNVVLVVALIALLGAAFVAVTACDKGKAADAKTEQAEQAAQLAQIEELNAKQETAKSTIAAPAASQSVLTTTPTTATPSAPAASQSVAATLTTATPAASQSVSTTASPASVTTQIDPTGDFKMNGTTLTGYTGTSTNINIPDGVTSIGKDAFKNNRSITSVTIGNKVTSIGQQAFDGCTKLTNVTFNGTLPTAGFIANAFNGDLHDKYFAAGGGIGTYIKQANKWAKIDPATGKPVSPQANRQEVAASRPTSTSSPAQVTAPANLPPLPEPKNPPANWNGPILTVGRVTAKRGEQATVTFTLQHNGLIGAEFIVEYDNRLPIESPAAVIRGKGALKYTMYEMTNYFVNSFKVYWGGLSTDKSVGELLSVRFTIPPSAPLGGYGIVLSKVRFSKLGVSDDGRPKEENIPSFWIVDGGITVTE